MNWRRGFFRLWVLGSALFVIAMAISNYAEIKHQFDLWNANETISWDVPVLCSDARGVEGKDFLLNAPWSEEGKGSCWYTLSKFRPLYPEYNDLSDEDLTLKLYKKRGISIQQPTNPWMTLLTDIGIAFGIPLIVLILGTTMAWVLSGFKATAA